jgi:hypothetical protein
VCAFPFFTVFDWIFACIVQHAVPGVPVLGLRAVGDIAHVLRWMQVARESAGFLSAVVIQGLIDGAIEVRHYIEQSLA